MVDIAYNFDNEYNHETQLKFLSLLIYDKVWAEISGLDVVKPEFFENRHLKNICKWIHEYYRKYKDVPTKLVLMENAKDYVNNSNVSNSEYFIYEDNINHIWELEGETDLEFFKEKAIVFARQVTWRMALSKGGKVLEIGNYDAAIEEFTKVLTIGEEADMGLDFSKLDLDKFLDDLHNEYDKTNMLCSGIPGWDAALGGGFIKANVHIIAAPPGVGKSLATYTPVLTPAGWKKASEIKIGDELIGRDGKPTKVLGVYPQGVISNYKVVFNDRSETNCCINHLWSVSDTQSHNKSYKTLSLGQILEKGLYKTNSPSRIKSGRKPAVRWKIPFVDPVEFETKNQFIPAYTMGAMIGDGCFISATPSLSNPEFDIYIKEKIEKELPDNIILNAYKSNEKACVQYNIVDKTKHAVNRFTDELRILNLYGKKSEEKFIPDLYKFGSVKQRIDLLHGLMDTDGSAEKGNKTRYATVSKQLAEDVVELVQSLGGMAHINVYTRKPRELHHFKDEICYSVVITLNKINPFSLPRKAQFWRETNRGRYIADVIKQEDVESVCFKVDNDESLFVIEHYIVTHNTKTMSFLAKQALLEYKRVVFITLELTENQIMQGIANCATGLSISDMMKPEYREEFKKKTLQFKNQFCDDLVIKFYRPDMITCNTINNYIKTLCRRKTEELGKEWKPDVIFLDYMDKILPTQKLKGNVYEDNGSVATDCKNLAITFDCPVITGSQLGRGGWNVNENQVISMASIAESAKKVHLAHSMTTINENQAEKTSGKCRFYMAKSRTGTPGKIIYMERNLGRGTLREIEEYDPTTLQSMVTCTIKSTDGK